MLFQSFFDDWLPEGRRSLGSDMHACMLPLFVYISNGTHRIGQGIMNFVCKIVLLAFTISVHFSLPTILLLRFTRAKNYC